MSLDPYIVDQLIEVGSRRVTRFFLLRMDWVCEDLAAVLTPAIYSDSVR